MMLSELWSAVAGDASRPPEVATGVPAGLLAARHDVMALALSSVAAALGAAAELAEARGAPRPALALDPAHVAAAFTSERHVLIDGRPGGAGFAPLSRFARTADGWIRLHANYPHHRRALLDALGVDEAGAPARIAEFAGEELEQAVVAAGGAAAAVRSPEQWARHPQGRAVAELPLVQRLAGPGAPPSARVAAGLGRPAARVVAAGAAPGGARLGAADVPPGAGVAARPAAGVRVLDLTRVIAGPVATRFLAALGADVLRLDPPHLRELPLGLADTGAGKRLAEVDFRRPDGLELLHALLADADVLVHGYRPGALAAFGLGQPELAERHPHLVTVGLSAWGASGPWGERRGFDSLVQAACGIAVVEGEPDGTPGALPAQALDHATGYLSAAVALRGLSERVAGRPPWSAGLALAATAAALMRLEPEEVVGADAARVGADGARVGADGARVGGDAARVGGDGPRAGEAVPPERFRVELRGDGGSLAVIAPPGTLDGQPLRWARPLQRTAPVWL